MGSSLWFLILRKLFLSFLTSKARFWSESLKFHSRRKGWMREWMSAYKGHQMSCGNCDEFRRGNCNLSTEVSGILHHQNDGLARAQMRIPDNVDGLRDGKFPVLSWKRFSWHNVELLSILIMTFAIRKLWIIFIIATNHSSELSNFFLCLTTPRKWNFLQRTFSLFSFPFSQVRLEKFFF